MIDRDAPNIRAALQWSIDHDSAGAAELIRDLASYWRTRGLLTEARSWTSRALASITARNQDRASLLCLAASFTTLQDELAESLRLSHEALDISREIGDPGGRAHALFRIAEAVHRQGHLNRAEALYREALQDFSASKDARGEMLCLGNLGMVARQRGELHAASELLEVARRRAADLGEQRIGGEFTIAMGWVQLDLDDLPQSRTLFERAFTEKSAANDRYGACAARHGLATVALKEGRLDEALQEYLATLDAANELRLKDYVARAFHGIAAIEAQGGAVEIAARFLGLADRLFEESGRELRDSVAYEVAAQMLDAAMPQARRASLSEEGARMHVTEALSELRAADDRARQPT
jgi:tetratricopeptide (TPR) repeat protein